MEKLLLAQAQAGSAGAAHGGFSGLFPFSRSLRQWQWDGGGVGWWRQAAELQGVIAQRYFPKYLLLFLTL